ncbi:hypothetical protein PABG_03132 [Paracoccidioides brasiliensis Pb03]|nr:hypothetical protein PABG_03132 [Paracoccidioides brasiliensis Pb03]
MQKFVGLVPLITSILGILATTVDARSQRRDSIGYISLVERPIIHTPSHRVHAFSHFDITFDLHRRQQRVKLTLEPNHDIFAEDAQVHFVDQAGNIQKSELINRQNHKVFKGWSWVESGYGNWERVGWARVVVKEDGPDPLFEGVFTIMHDHHHILLRSSYVQTRHELDPHLDDTTAEYMVVFRDSDIGQPAEDDGFTKRNSFAERLCAADNLPFNSDLGHPVFRAMTRRDNGLWGSMSFDSVLGLARRQSDMPGTGGSGVNLRLSIGSTAGCPSTRKVALIGVAADCTYTASFSSQQRDALQAARENIIQVVNGASQIYEQTFNISLGLRNLTVFPPDCPATAPSSALWNVDCSDNGSPDISSRLNIFSAWRGQQQDNNAFWTLMSNCRTGPEVGLAWLGQLCNREAQTRRDPNNSVSQTVSGANVVARTSNEWQVLAHEVGHTFGAVHDCDGSLCSESQEATSQCCPLSRSSCDAGGQFIMNPTSGRGVTQFSPCSVGNICSGLGRNSVRSDCLSNNRGVVTITGSQCGNGIVEEGEDCDCGGEEGCRDNTCCDARTCKFKSNAVCDDSNEDCCSNCQFKSSDMVCRASTGPCDPEEKCTGSSSSCPPDTSSPDGENCGEGLTCASGQCTSRNQQCRTMMGNSLSGNETIACDDRTCLLACSSPQFSRNQCLSINQNFLDGTPCAAGGRCRNGLCEGSSFGNEVRSWIGRNRPLVIGLAAGIGGLILLSVLSCIFKRCRRPRRRETMDPMTQETALLTPTPSNPGWSGPTPPGQWASQPAQRGPGARNFRPFDPMFPPPAYRSTMAARGGMPSVRYA